MLMLPRELNYFCDFTTAGKDLVGKINLSSPSDFDYCLLIVAPIVCGSFVLGLCFVVQNFMSFLVLQLPRWGREG